MGTKHRKPQRRPSPIELLSLLVRIAGTPRVRPLFGAIRLAVAEDGATGAEWVRAAQTLHDLGAIDDDEFTYLVMIFTEEIMGTRMSADPTLAELAERIEVVERSHGLAEDEAFLVGQGPADWEALQRAWDDEFNRQWAALVRELGEPELAARMMVDPERLRESEEHGREFFFGPLDADEDDDVDPVAGDRIAPGDDPPHVDEPDHGRGDEAGA